MLRLAVALWRFWHYDNLLGEGRDWLARALAAAGPVPAGLRVEALTGAAMIAQSQGDDDEASALCAEASVLAAGIADNDVIARLRYVQGEIEQDAGRYESAEPLFEEAESLFAAAGIDHWANMARQHLGMAARGRGDRDRARTFLEQALTEHRAGGHRWAASLALIGLAQVALAGADTPGASGFLGEACGRGRAGRAPLARGRCGRHRWSSGGRYRATGQGGALPWMGRRKPHHDRRPEQVPRAHAVRMGDGGFEGVVGRARTCCRVDYGPVARA
jgi:tetratricopeptide (TPR) repeat protein